MDTRQIVSDIKCDNPEIANSVSDETLERNVRRLVELDLNENEIKSQIVKIITIQSNLKEAIDNNPDFKGIRLENISKIELRQLVHDPR